MNNQKRNLGQYNTKENIWLKPQVKEFIAAAGCDTIVDPYAGGGDILYALDEYRWVGYDIDPDMHWEINDSLTDIPYWKDSIVVTNPPYLAKNSALRNNLDNYKYFKGNDFVDLYQIAIENVLIKYKHAVFIIPETYVLSEFFKNWLRQITILEENPFTDTDCPVCVACFEKDNNFLNYSSNIYKIYKNNDYLFTNFELEDIKYEFLPTLRISLEFNDPKGNLGLRAVDGTSPNDRIRFCFPQELGYSLDDIVESSRSITTISMPHIDISPRFIDELNKTLEDFRARTYDVTLAPFKNNNKIGKRRRRLDYRWARRIIERTLEKFSYGA